VQRVVSWFGWFGRGSLLLRFSLLSLLVLTLIAAGLAAALQQQMAQDALRQQADEVAVIVQGVLGRHLKAPSLSPATTVRQRAWWGGLAEQLLQADSHVVRIKVWNTHGQIVYSNDPRQIGQTFAIDENLQTALAGRRAMDISTLSASENAGDRRGHTALLETYIPIRVGARVIGAYEAYCDLALLNQRLSEAQRTIWASVAVGFVLLYASLFAIVRNASRRLVRQMREIALLGAQAREAEALRQVDRLKDEFVGGISHELRRPLASIKGYTASLLLPEAHWAPAEQREFLQVIDEEADHLAGLIDNLLDLARLGSGSLPLNREPLHLPALTEQVVRRVRAQAQLPPHPYEVRFPERFPYVEADSARMTQVLLNLLENGAKYAPAGTPIEVDGCAEEGAVKIRVRDWGPGLTPEQAARVFDKFYRVESGLTRATEGTGLGLAICRGVVEAHGGEITVDATPGQGCAFTVTLPALPASAPLPVAVEG
jgi:signal transduction histidine kinase